ncbi:hypothetical protein [Halomonas sp. RA08-2]|uniref:hypothetical protein n=1 Tax=Halomonas sp. RA08-2 TaxID=3440842 RepID=UPI003EE98A70
MTTCTTRRIIAASTGVHPYTVYQWAKGLPNCPEPIGSHGRTLLLPAEETYAWLKSHGRATPEQIDAMREREVLA